MKSRIFTGLMVMFLFIGISAVKAQGDRGQKIEAMRISFFTEQLSLTPDEAKTFWPVFNQFENEKRTLREQYGKKPGEGEPDIANMTDAQAEKMINDEIAFEQKDLDITKKYVAEFKKILSTKKVAILLTLDNKWKRMILNQIRGGENGPPPGK